MVTIIIFVHTYLKKSTYVGAGKENANTMDDFHQQPSVVFHHQPQKPVQDEYLDLYRSVGQKCRKISNKFLNFKL